MTELEIPDDIDYLLAEIARLRAANAVIEGGDGT